MLNITENSVSHLMDFEKFSSYKSLRRSHRVRKLSFILLGGVFLILLICMFLPWWQNVNAKGYVTTRAPQQRPQSIESVIAGRLEKWYVQEGDFVKQGDTVAYISEIKSEYFDPELLARTSEQLEAKSLSITSYENKVAALRNQYVALEEALGFKRRQIENKILQAENKISMDSIELVALGNNLSITENQLSRTSELYDKGLKSLTEMQDKEYKLQAARAKYNVQKNKLVNRKNEYDNLAIDLSAVEQEYADKMAKSVSDQQSAVSSRLESVANTSKLRNQLSNYTERQKFYHIIAPQDGYITKTLKKGIGETVKEGTSIATIMPAEYELAIETYIKPQDIPLLKIDDVVTIRFDGWPAVVISGWPETSTGVFEGKIAAIDQFIGENGFYRILISPGDESRKWPHQLRVGTGANAFILMNKVPVWYEVWRQLNGFPMDYYRNGKKHQKDVKLKAPLKSVK